MIIADSNVSIPTCPSCSREIKTTWKYCRYCGNNLQQSKDASASNETVLESLPSTSEISIDKETLFKILKTRKQRNSINKKKSELKAEIKHVMEQKKAGFLDNDLVVEKIKKLKAGVEEVNKLEDSLSGIPESLAIEELVDQIDATKERIVKIKSMKEKKGISQDTLENELKKSLATLDLLKAEHSKIGSRIRTWQNEFEAIRNSLKKDLEALNLKKELGEISANYYNEEKKKYIEDLESYDFVIKNIDLILKVW